MKIFILFLLLVIVGCSYAQTEVGFRLGFGEGGIKLIDLDENLSSGNRLKPKLYQQYGIDFTHAIADNFFLRSGFLFSRIAVDDIIHNRVTGIDTFLRVESHSYIQLPIILQYKLFWNIKLEAGLANNFIVIKEKEAMWRDYKFYDPAFCFGGNITILEHIEIGYTDYRFFRYFSKIDSGDFYFKNEAWCFYATIKYPLGKSPID